MISYRATESFREKKRRFKLSRSDELNVEQTERTDVVSSADRC